MTIMKCNADRCSSKAAVLTSRRERNSLLLLVLLLLLLSTEQPGRLLLLLLFVLPDASAACCMQWLANCSAGTTQRSSTGATLLALKGPMHSQQTNTVYQSCATGSKNRQRRCCRCCSCCFDCLVSSQVCQLANSPAGTPPKNNTNSTRWLVLGFGSSLEHIVLHCSVLQC
jgi:hypothetical protein